MTKRTRQAGVRAEIRDAWTAFTNTPLWVLRTLFLLTGIVAGFGIGVLAGGFTLDYGPAVHIGVLNGSPHAARVLLDADAPLPLDPLTELLLTDDTLGEHRIEVFIDAPEPLVIDIRFDAGERWDNADFTIEVGEVDGMPKPR